MDDKLLRQADWVRRLASDLTGHREEAEDLAQETFLRAVRRPPPAGMDEGRLRAWLRTIARNLLIRRAESNAARSSRERDVASQSELEAVPPRDCGDDLRERLQAALKTLDEETTHLLMLRYESDLRPSEIALRLGLPGTVIRKRLSRALARLGEQLGRPQEESQRRTLRGITLLGGSLTSWRDRVAALFSGIPTPWVMAACGSVIVLLALVVWRGEDVEAHLTAADIEAVVGRRHEVPLGTQTELEPAIAPAHTSRSPVITEQRDAPGPDILQGIVVDTVGIPVGQVEVVFQRGEPISYVSGDLGFQRDRDATSMLMVRSRDDGTFSIPVPTDVTGRVMAHSDLYTTVVAELAPRERLVLTDLQVIVARRRTVTGQVIDRGGDTMSCAVVTFEAADVSGLGCKNPLFVRPRTRSEYDGSFVLDDCYESERASIVVYHDGYPPARVALDAMECDVTLTLGGLDTVEPTVGRVSDSLGRAIPQAIVSVDGRVFRADGDGRFPVPRFPTGHWPSIRAISTGYLPVEWVPASLDEEVALAVPVELTLGERPGTLIVRVLDPLGRPVPECDVWVSDPTPFGFLNTPRFVEALSAPGEDLSVKRVTDASGIVEIGGLMNRTYLLRIVRPGTPSFAELRATPGPTLVDCVLNPVAADAAGNGRVLTRFGDPVVGARVSATVNVVDVPFPSLGGSVVVAAKLASATTNAHGEFELPHLPPDGVIRVTGPNVISASYSIARMGPSPVELVVSQPARVRFSIVAGERSDLLSAHNDAGEVMSLYDSRDDLVHKRSVPYDRISIAMASEAEWIVPSEAVWLTLFRDGVARGTVEVRLSSGQLNHVELR
jgi:RNA polymerase sigma-70 factor (ECF subfamily)